MGTGLWKRLLIAHQVMESFVMSAIYRIDYNNYSGYSGVLSVTEWWSLDYDGLDENPGSLLPAIVILSSIPIVDASGSSASWTRFNPSLVQIIDEDIQDMDNTTWGTPWYPFVQHLNLTRLPSF